LIHPVEGWVPEYSSKYFDATKRYVYHSNVPVHYTEDYFKLKNEIETLSNNGTIQNCNPLPNHRNQGVNMITLDEEYDLKGTIVTIGNTEAPRIPFQRATMSIVQMRPTVIVQTYQRQLDAAIGDGESQECKTITWMYQQKGKAKMIDSAASHVMTRCGRCYAPEDENRGNLGREQKKMPNSGRECRPGSTPWRSS